jgi:hypothetical protein
LIESDATDRANESVHFKGMNLFATIYMGVEEEQQIRHTVTVEIAGAAPVNPATFQRYIINTI